MSFVEASFEGAGVVVCRTGYTGERGYELIAPQRRRRRAVGRAAGGRRGARDARLRARAPATRCAPRWATRCTARTSPSTSRPTRPGSAGRSAGRRTRSGAATRCSPRRRPGRSGCCAGWSRSAAASRGPGMSVTLTRDVPARRGHLRHLLADAAQGHRAGAGADRRSTADAEVGVDVRGRREIFQLVKLRRSSTRPCESPDVANVPDQPPTFRAPTPAERPWRWRLENAAGAEVVGRATSRRPAVRQPGRRRVVGRRDLVRAGRRGRRRGDAVRARPAGLRADVAARLTEPPDPIRMGAAVEPLPQLYRWMMMGASAEVSGGRRR